MASCPHPLTPAPYRSGGTLVDVVVLASSVRALGRRQQRTGYVFGSGLCTLSLASESLDLTPPDEDHVIIGEGLPKFGAGNHIDVALAPSGIPHRKVDGDRAHLRVVVREMHK